MFVRVGSPDRRQQFYKPECPQILIDLSQGPHSQCMVGPKTKQMFWRVCQTLANISATTFLAPVTCCTSVENSEINAKLRISWHEQPADLERMQIRGAYHLCRLWKFTLQLSVGSVWCLNKLTSAGVSFLEKNAKTGKCSIGLKLDQFSPIACSDSDASIVRAVGTQGSGWHNKVALTKTLLFFAATNAPRNLLFTPPFFTLCGMVEGIKGSRKRWNQTSLKIELAQEILHFDLTSGFRKDLECFHPTVWGIISHTSGLQAF